jgi:hypothetical protein
MDLTFNAMPFLEESLEARDHPQPASLTAKHLLPDEHLFGCLDEAVNQEEVANEANSYQKSAEADDQGSPALLEIGGKSLPKPPRDEASLFVESAPGDTLDVRDELGNQSSSSKHNLPCSESVSSSAAALRHKSTATEGSEGFQKLFSSGVFEFGDQNRREAAETINYKNARRAIDTPAPRRYPLTFPSPNTDLGSDQAIIPQKSSHHMFERQNPSGRALTRDDVLQGAAPHRAGPFDLADTMTRARSPDLYSELDKHFQPFMATFIDSREEPRPGFHPNISSVDLNQILSHRLQSAQTHYAWSKSNRHDLDSQVPAIRKRHDEVFDLDVAKGSSRKPVTESLEWKYLAHNYGLPSQAQEAPKESTNDTGALSATIEELDKAVAHEAAAEKLRESWAAWGQCQEQPGAVVHGDTMWGVTEGILQRTLTLHHIPKYQPDYVREAGHHWHQQRRGEGSSHDIIQNFWQTRRHS